MPITFENVLMLCYLFKAYFYSYTGLLDHFAAVSYGHQIFSAFLLFPLQQKHSLSFRKDFWIDHAHILRLITLTPSQVFRILFFQCLISINFRCPYLWTHSYTQWNGNQTSCINISKYWHQKPSSR